MATTTAPGRDRDEAGTPAEVAAYAEVDVSGDSPIGRALERLLAEEDVGGRTPIHLTPMGFTPAMDSWFTRHVGAKRNAAIQAIRARFARDRLKDVPSIFLEYELDQARGQALADKSAAVDEFRRGTAEKRRDVEAAARAFEVIHAEEGGRSPRMISPWLYWIALTVIVMLEFFLNYESFRSVPWIGSPFLAFCLTVLVGAGLGLASHLHGTLLRQWEYYFGPHDKTRNFQGRRMLAIGGAVFTLAMGAALGARYYYILPEIVEARLLGLAPPSLFGSLAFMGAGNLIVYLVAAAWAYLTHDERPDYPEAKRKADRLQGEYDALFARQVTAELNRIDQRVAKDTGRLATRDTMQNVSPNYEPNRQLVAMLRAKDDDVIAALKDHRARLCRQAPDALYLYPDHTVLSESRTVTMSAGQWAAAELVLRLSAATGA